MTEKNNSSTRYNRGETSSYQRKKRAREQKRRQRRIILALVSLLLLAVIIVLIGNQVLTDHSNITTIFSSVLRQEENTAITEQTVSTHDTAAAGSQDTAADDVHSEEPVIIVEEDGTDAQSTELTDSADNQVSVETQTASIDKTAAVTEAIAYADRLAAGYDYDGAIAYLEEHANASDAAIVEAIAGYRETKASCVAVDVTTVPHIFYHSLVNEPDIAFDASRLGQFAADGMNAWMTTVDEFDKITQQLYDNGYVYVRLRDLVTETTDENGSVHFSPRTDLLLPPGKKAIVLSIDDLSYYHSYEAASFPDKLVLDENGSVKCHYVMSDGTESIGDYDVVPRLNTFLEEHPDGAYQGARGLIALTGYNGVFGYRTDIDYEKQERLMSDQAAWLAQHPDFSRDEEIRQATIIAEALKEEGWEFASHTWGHLSVTAKTAEELAADNEKWVNNVQNIVGETDTIIFAHGNDIGDWMPYSDDNEKYAVYKNAGYKFFCNVDGSVPYWVQINDTHVRQGRIDLDGYMLYQSSIGATTTIDQLITASEVFDSRRPTPVVANGE